MASWAGEGNLDWNEEITHTQMILVLIILYISATMTVPCVYIRNRRVVNLDPNDPIEVSYSYECPFDDIPTATKNPELHE